VPRGRDIAAGGFERGPDLVAGHVLTTMRRLPNGLSKGTTRLVGRNRNPPSSRSSGSRPWYRPALSWTHIPSLATTA
jgi:hypothetical protein